MAFSIKQIIPVPIKRAVKRLLGIEKPKPAAAAPRAKPAKTASGSKPAAAKPPRATPSRSGSGSKGKGSGKRRGPTAKG